MADIQGTNGNDAIDGTAGDDLITGGVGNDTIEAGAGNDTLIGDGGSAGGTGSSGTILGDGPGSTGGGYDRVYGQSVYNGNHTFSTDAFYLGNDIPVLDDANRNAITGVSFSQDGEGTDRTFGLDELSFTGAQRSYVGLVTVQNVDVHNANDQFSSSLSGGFQDVSVVSSGTADFTMNDGQVFQGIRVNFVRGPDGETYMMPDDGPSPYAFNAFRNMLATNDSGIDSFKIATGSGDDAGINPIEGNWADGQFAEITNPPVGDSFDDVLCGDEGDDIIYGDGGDSATAAGFGVAGGLLGDGPGSTGGGYDRVYAQSEYNGNHSFSTDAFYLGNDIPVLDDANRNAITGVSFSQDGEGTDRTFGLDELEFTGAQRSYVGLVTVQNVDVHNANDQFSSSLSGGFQDVSVVSSGTADFTMNDGQVFQGIRVNFVRGPDGETYMMPDDGPSPYAFNAFRNMLATNDSGIDSFKIATGSGDDAGINPIEGNWADGQFKVTQDGEGGDDIIKGGAGSDTMFGEGGDDTFLVESAADGAGDVVVGGNGPDQNTDTDVLDLRGAGVVTIDAVADDNDAGAQSGTVTFNNGETLTFEGIEEILQDEPALTIAPAPGTQTDPATGNPLTAENGTPAQIVITRNTPTDEALEVFLTNGDPSETDAPVSVTIPAGAAFVIVDIPSVDDPIVDGDQISTITATANGFDPVSQDVTVADDDVPTLTIEPGPNTPIDPATGLPVTQENGDPVELVVTRNTDTTEALEVTIQNGDPSETNPPITVTIPAGEDSVSFLVDPVDDPIVDGDQTSPITATAPGFTPDTQDVLVEDDDEPALTIEPGPNTPIDPATGLPVTQENGDPVELVVTRNTDTTEALEVTIQNGDPSETNPPITVTIPAGEDSVSFLVDPVDDPIVDGDQTSPITATAPGFTPDTQDVLVEDDDEPTLTIEPGPNTPIDPATGLPVTQENGDPVELVVTRNTDTTEALEVTIQNGDPSETNPPITVTIPAGEDSVSFLVDPVDDPIVDGDQTSPITATAPGFTPDTQDVLVEDDDEPTLTIAPGPNTPIDPATGLPVTQENGDPVELVVTRNTDTTEALEVTIQNGDPSETNPPLTVTIPAGEDSVAFLVDPVDDPIVDGDQTSPITATAPGFTPDTQDVLVEDDDEPALTIAPGPNTPIDPATGLPVTQENGDPVELVVTRNTDTTEALEVTIQNGDPSETNPPLTVTIPAGEDSVAFLVDPVDDPIVDGDQTSPITATAPGFTPDTQDVLVEDDDEPALTIAPGPNTPIDPATGLPVTQENGDPVELVVTRNTDTTEALEVTIQNGDPSETNPPITVTIPAGEDSVSFLVDPVDDPIVDGDQTSPITATAPGFTPDTQDVLVEDDDAPTLTIEPGPNTPIDPATGLPVTQENGDPVELVVTRNTDTTEALEVTIQNGDPSETNPPITVTIPAGEDSVAFLVDPVDDPIVDGDQTSPITATAPGFTPDTQDVLVEDDDEPALTIEPGPNTPIDPATGLPVTQENGDPVELVVTRNTDTTEALEVTIQNGDPSETNPPITVTIPAGEDSVSFLVDPVDDPIVDGDQTSPITATAPGFTPDTQDVLVEDDDEPTLTIAPGPNTPIDPATGLPVTQENGDPVELVVTRNTDTTEALEVTIQNGDPSETNPPITVTIPAGEDSVSFLVDPVDDPIVDGDQTSPITATAPGFTPDTQDVLVEDDDEPTLTIAPGPNTPIDPATGLPVTQENGDPVELVVTRNTDTTEALEVTIQNGDPSETNPPLTVTIPAGEDSVAFLVDPVDDPIVDGDQTSPITATAPGFTPDTQDVLVEDDDEPALTIEPGPNTPIDPATGLPVTQENGDPVELVVTRNTDTTEALEVTIQNGDPSETNPPLTVTIPAGEDSVAFLVDPVDDPIVDGDQTSPITATAPGFTPDTQDVLVEDDDVLEFAPVAGDDVVLETPEDTPLTIDVLNNDVDPDGDDADLIIVGAEVVSGSGTVEIVNNELLFTPELNYNGPVELSYTIEDPQGLQDSAKVVICCVTPVNDPPVANDDFRTISFDFYENDANGVIGIRNVLNNDDDPDLVDGDEIKVAAAGGDTTPNSRGWFDWTDASEGGQIRVNVDGRSQFRNGDVFADVPVGESVTTFIEYTIEDLAGLPATAKVGVIIEGTAVPDPETSSIGDKVFLDTDGDGIQDVGETGVNGVVVTLFDENNMAIDTDITTGDGDFLFDGLAAGDYTVGFHADGFDFTLQDQGTDEALDSDVDVTTGRTGTITLGVNDQNDDVDAGLVIANNDPQAQNDDGMTCADEVLTLDVLSNDFDDDDDPLTITQVDGQAITDGGSVTTAAGTIVTLTGGQLVIDGTNVAAYTALDINQEALETFSYTVDDGFGGTDDAIVSVTFKGDANSVEGLALNLPDSATIQVVDENDPAGSSDEAYTIRISDGNESIDGIYAEAYCISAFDPFVADGFGDDVALAPAFGGADVYLGLASEVPAGVLETIGINGATAADNLDEITWILNQDFSNNGFTDAEVQGAIWALTDGESIENDFGFAGGIFVTPGSGDVADAQMIVDMALTTGSGFEAEDGDIVAVVVDPNETNFEQPFVFGVAYDDLDCIC